MFHQACLFMTSTLLYLQMKEALARSKGNLAEAERIAPEDRGVMMADVDADDVPASTNTTTTTTTTATTTTSKQKKDIDDPILANINRWMAAAQSELAAVRQAMTTVDPITEHTAFLDWVKSACKMANDDQWFEFQISFTTMYTRWKSDDHQRQQQQ